MDLVGVALMQTSRAEESKSTPVQIDSCSWRLLYIFLFYLCFGSIK